MSQGYWNIKKHTHCISKDPLIWNKCLCKCTWKEIYAKKELCSFKKKKVLFFLLLGITIVCLQNRIRFLQFVNSVPPLACQRLVYPMQRPYFPFMVTNDFPTLCFLGFQYRFWILWGRKWKKKKTKRQWKRHFWKMSKVISYHNEHFYSDSLNFF